MRTAAKVALVTGAAGNGMGRSIALTLAREGAQVVVNYRTSGESADAVVRTIAEQGGEAAAFQADITRRDECEALVGFSNKKYGRIDICVIGPGAGWHADSIDSLDSMAALDDIQKELAPLYHLMPLVLPSMYQRRWGRIVAIALIPPYESPAYAYNVAKAARVQAALSSRDTAWKNGITINTIAPGPVPAMGSLEEAVDACAHGPSWQKRTTTSPQDIAEAVAFLCSDAGDYISGSVLPFLHRAT